ncbi:MAG: hypothetical protein K2X43_20785 [Hyphomonadaceae bacterium]|jgi:hypothetical protein|nr:hypothetical protein [Hyphomonadaceae bacterium]
MEDKAREAAFAAANKAHTLVASARRHLMGYRLPLAGIHYDLRKAAIDLRAAQHEIDVALQLVAAAPTAAPASDSAA